MVETSVVFIIMIACFIGGSIAGFWYKERSDVNE